MASKTEKQRILSSGLNLLPPGEKLADGEALQFDNWRVDQAGELRSRKGAINYWAGYGSGVFHTLARAGADRYAGIGTGLFYTPGTGAPTSIAAGFFDGNPLGVAFYQAAGWFMNRLRQLRITGSTVQNWGIAPPTTAPMVASVANNLIGVEGWNETSPGQNPVTFPGLSVGYLDGNGNFNNFPAGAASFDTAILQEGASSLKVNAANPALWVVTDNLYTERGSALDTTGGIPAADNDYYSFWFYCTNPAAIDTFSVLIFSGNYPGGPSQQVVAVKLNVGGLNLAPNTWTQISIKRNVDCDKFINQISSLQNQINAAAAAGSDTTDLTAQLNDVQAQFNTALATPHFTEIVAGRFTMTNVDMVPGDPPMPANITPYGTALSRGMVTQIDWTKVSAIQFQINLTQPCVFNLDIATFTTSGTLTGSGQYFVSFANAANEDSNLSPASSILTCQNASALLSGIAVSADPQVTQRWIWRTGFGSNQVLKVGTIADNTTTTFTDTMSVAAAQAINATAPADRDQPPAASGCMGPYFGKILAWSSAAHPARYWWTNSGEPWHFPGAGDVDGNWEDAGNDDDQLIAITNHNQYALMYKQRSLWLLPGDPANVDAQLIDTSIGLVGPRAVCNAGQIDYFMGPEGVYLRNQDYKAKISGVLDPIFKGDSVLLSTGTYLPPIDPVNIVNSVLEIVNDRLYVSYPEQGSTYPNVTLICQLPGQTAFGQLPSYRWSRMKLNLGSSTTGFTALKYEGAGNSLMAAVTAAGAGQLWAIEQASTALDGANPIPLAWQSRFSDQGLPDNFKWYSDIVIDFQTSFGGFQPVSTLSVSIVYDNGTVLSLGTIASSNRTTQVFSLSSLNIQVEGATDEGLRAKNIAVQITGNATSTCIIYNVYVHWYPEERAASTIDSGFTDLGQPERVKQVDYLELYLTGAGQTIQRILSSDLPGNVLTQRDTNTFTAPLGRGNARMRLPSLIEGRNFRFTFTAQALNFQIHKLRVRQRVIGEYVDGTIGEYYESPDFIVDNNQVAEWKDLLLDYEVSGVGATVVIYSDLPGYGLAIRRTLNVPVESTRLPFLFQLEDGSLNLPYGRIFKVRVYPPSGGYIRLHGPAIIRSRAIGEWLDGTLGQFYLSPQFSVAPGRVGELKDFMLDYDASAAGGQVIIYTDLPGQSGLQAARTLSLPVQGATRQPYTFAGEDFNDVLAYGDLFQVKIVPPPTGILRLHGRASFRVRPIGVYFDGSQGEVWETQPLDLLGGTAIYREIVIVAQTGGAMTLEVETDLPNLNMAVVASIAVNTTLTTSGRAPVVSRLPGNTKGRLTKFRVQGNYPTRLFELKVLARRLGVNGGDWQWVNVPLPPTPDDFAQFNMPVRETPEAWNKMPMPVRTTPEEFTWIDLPVDAVE